MTVTRLATQGFRNLEDGEVFPCPGVNVIYGANAQGKTNLLEALWLFTGGHSFRGAKDVELPRLDPATGENRPSAALALDFFTEGRPQKAQLRLERGRRSSVINGVPKPTGSALIGKVRAVIFSPDHLLLVKEGPIRRRAFLDGALCQLRPGYPAAYHQYARALAQRNALLKEISQFPVQRDLLEVWDARLARLGAVIMADRRSFVERMGPLAAQVYEGISRGREELVLEYAPSPGLEPGMTTAQWEEAFLRELTRTGDQDIRRGATGVGPHKDDLEITLSGLSARRYGSQGQQRSAVLAMKLAEAQTLSQLSGETPIVLLDDVMSELDQSRQDYLLNHLHGRQVFVTCCSPETVSLQETGKRFRVEAGRVFPEEVGSGLAGLEQPQEESAPAGPGDAPESGDAVPPQESPAPDVSPAGQEPVALELPAPDPESAPAGPGNGMESEDAVPPQESPVPDESPAGQEPVAPELPASDPESAPAGPGDRLESWDAVAFQESPAHEVSPAGGIDPPAGDS